MPLSLAWGCRCCLLGTSGGKLLPGRRLDGCDLATFGFALLAVPILLLSRLLSDQVATLLWLGWGWCCAVISITTTSIAPIRRAEPRRLRPVAGDDGSGGGGRICCCCPRGQCRPRPRPRFIPHQDPGRSQGAARRRPRQAGAAGSLRRLVRGLQEFEHKTFSDPDVQARFSEMVLLQADVTANDDADVDLLNGLNVLGLPTLIFFDRDGNEVNGQRVTGFMGPVGISRPAGQAALDGAPAFGVSPRGAGWRKLSWAPVQPRPGRFPEDILAVGGGKNCFGDLIRAIPHTAGSSASLWHHGRPRHALSQIAGLILPRPSLRLAGLRYRLASSRSFDEKWFILLACWPLALWLQLAGPGEEASRARSRQVAGYFKMLTCSTSATSPCSARRSGMEGSIWSR